MQQDQEAHGDIQFLTGSLQRPAVLGALCEQPARPHELCAEIDATRTTIQRILAGFRDRQWVVKDEGDYRATVTGRRVYDRYDSLASEVQRAQAFGPLATHLGPIADDFPVEAVDTGRLTVSENGDPLAAVSHFTEWMQSIEGPMYAVSPVVAQPFNEIGAELLASGVEIEMVIDATVLEQSKANYESNLQLGADHENVAIYVADEPLTLGVALDDRRSCLGAYDGNNNIRAVLESDDDAMHEWARGVYQHYRERATPLEVLYGDESAVEGIER